MDGWKRRGWRHGLAATALLASLAAQGAVDLEFRNVGRYGDGLRALADQQGELPPLLEAVSAAVSKAAACLPADSTLSIRITDLRLAGRREWWHAGFLGNDIRVLRDDTWPSADLDYSLQTAVATAPAVEQHAHLSDMNYLHRGAPSAPSDGFPYEERMLREWIVLRFCQH